MSANDNDQTDSQAADLTGRVAMTERGALALAVMLIEKLQAVIGEDFTGDEAANALDEAGRFFPILRDVAKLTPENKAAAWGVLSAIATQIAKDNENNES